MESEHYSMLKKMSDTLLRIEKLLKEMRRDQKLEKRIKEAKIEEAEEC